MNDIDPFTPKKWLLAHGHEVEIGARSIIMGILNVTPDSFSDGGENDTLQSAIASAKLMINEGAAIIDIGGESTRPGAKEVSAQEEQDRVLPVIEALSELAIGLISIDTYRAQTAELAVKAGAHIINDVWGCQREPEIAVVAAQYRAGLCAMHTGRERQKQEDVIADQLGFLSKTLQITNNVGIDRDQIVLDPGFGFAKNSDENIELLARFEELIPLGYPLLAGTSRKRFIGHITGRDAQERDIGTAATSVVARMKGAAIFRVHDVRANKDALAIVDAILANKEMH
jgi:dihydropteroate synthase